MWGGIEGGSRFTGVNALPIAMKNEKNSSKAFWVK
jgi:hypothetical protein